MRTRLPRRCRARSGWSAADPAAAACCSIATAVRPMWGVLNSFSAVWRGQPCTLSRGWLQSRLVCVAPAVTPVWPSVWQLVLAVACTHVTIYASWRSSGARVARCLAWICATYTLWCGMLTGKHAGGKVFFEADTKACCDRLLQNRSDKGAGYRHTARCTCAETWRACDTADVLFIKHTKGLPASSITLRCLWLRKDAPQQRRVPTLGRRGGAYWWGAPK